MDKSILTLIIFIILIIFLIFENKIIIKHKIKINNEHGSARFSNIHEIKKIFTKEKTSNIKQVGFPIWFSKNLKYVWFDKETPHWIFLGSTGSGKSATAVIPQCSFIANSKEKKSVFITDPKGEIFNSTSQMFKNNNYEVLTIDFRKPELSNKFNILSPIINEYDNYIKCKNKGNNEINETKKIEFDNKAISSYAETNKLISSLSNIIMQEKTQQKDPFWNNSAKNLLEGLIGFFLEEYKLGNIKKNQITMTSIRKFQNSLMIKDNLEKFMNYILQKPYGSKAKDSLIPILSASENTYKSITAVFGEKMSIFDDVNVSNITNKSDFDLDIFSKKQTVLYVIVPDEDKIYYPLITIIISMLYKELVKVANSKDNKKLPIEMEWLLDEFANCPPLYDIEAIISVARSRGMKFYFFIQSFAQLNNVYGKDIAQIILDNCGLVYLKTNTQETAEAISKKLGKKTITSSSISQSLNFSNNNGNCSTSLIARDLLTPDEIKQLHYKTIIFPINSYPIYRNTVIYNKFKCYEKGSIKRKVTPLLDLSDTYFTIENLQIDNSNDKKELIDEQQKHDKNLLIEAEEIYNDIFKNYNNKVKYKYINNKLVMYFSISRNLNNGDKFLLDNRISKNKYHIEIVEYKDRTVIETHLKVY